MDDREGAPESVETEAPMGGLLDALRLRLSTASSQSPDEPGVGFVRRLVDEAARTGEALIRSRLLSRANVRLEILEAQPDGRLTVGSEFKEEPRPRDELARQARTRALTHARRRGVRLPDAGQGALGASETLYRRRVDDVRVGVTIQEATRAVPESAGRYHAGAVAADALEALRGIRGGYLAAQLGRIEAYGVLAAFADSVLAEKPPKPGRK